MQKIFQKNPQETVIYNKVGKNIRNIQSVTDKMNAFIKIPSFLPYFAWFAVGKMLFLQKRGLKF